VILAAVVVSTVVVAASQSPPPPIDLTGYWVSIVTEDWRWRMVTPPKGDLASVPLNEAGRKVANSWDPATDGSCLAYGAGAGMRNPTRLHVSWESDQVLKIEMDAGAQTRRLLFDPKARPGPRSLQGFSKAVWERTGGRGQGGNLKVVTTNLTAGWLRKNGVPYSQDAVVTEYFDRFTTPNADEWLVVTTTVEDPTYLTQPFVTSTHFRREPDPAKFRPTACK
jgi:hypothetical protein